MFFHNTPRRFVNKKDKRRLVLPRQLTLIPWSMRNSIKSRSSWSTQQAFMNAVDNVDIDVSSPPQWRRAVLVWWPFHRYITRCSKDRNNSTIAVWVELSGHFDNQKSSCSGNRCWRLNLTLGFRVVPEFIRCGKSDRFSSGRTALLRLA